MKCIYFACYKITLVNVEVLLFISIKLGIAVKNVIKLHNLLPKKPYLKAILRSRAKR